MRSWKEGVCQSTALSPGWECLLEGPADPCAPPGHSPFPCPAWLCFPPLGSVSWLRMPGLLRTVLRQDSGDGRGRDGPAGGFAQRHSASSLVGLPGRACKPCRASPALLSLPPAPTLLQPAFFLRGFGTRAESQASPVSSPLPPPGSSRDALSWTQRSPAAPASSTQSLMLIPVSRILSLNQSCHLACFFVVLSFIVRIQKTDTDPFPKALGLLPAPHRACLPRLPGQLWGASSLQPEDRRWESSSAPLLSKQIPPGSTT